MSYSSVQSVIYMLDSHDSHGSKTSIDGFVCAVNNILLVLFICELVPISSMAIAVKALPHKASGRN